MPPQSGWMLAFENFAFVTAICRRPRQESASPPSWAHCFFTDVVLSVLVLCFVGIPFGVFFSHTDSLRRKESFLVISQSGDPSTLGLLSLPSSSPQRAAVVC